MIMRNKKLQIAGLRDLRMIYFWMEQKVMNKDLKTKDRKHALKECIDLLNKWDEDFKGKSFSSRLCFVFKRYDLIGLLNDFSHYNQVKCLRRLKDEIDRQTAILKGA